MNGTKLATEILPLIDGSILIQGFALNLLWIILFWGWIINNKNTSSFPKPFLFIFVAIIWLIVLVVGLREIDANQMLFTFAIANGVALSILNPTFALCFTISMYLMRPWELLINNVVVLALPRFTLFLSLLWTFFYWIMLDRFSLKFNKIIVIFITYIVWTFLSTFASNDPNYSRMVFNEQIVRSATVFFLIYHLARDRFSIWALKSSIIIVLTSAGAVALYYYFNKYTDGGRILAYGMLANSNDIAAVMNLVIPLIVTPWFSKKYSFMHKMISFIPLSICLTTLFYAQSRGAILALAVSGGVYFLLKVKRKSIAVILMLFVLFIGQFAMSALKRDSGDLKGSSESRISFWVAGIRMGFYKPLFGVGLAGYEENYEKYALFFGEEFGERTAHSSWVLALAETGIIGLILYFYLYWSTALKGAYYLKDFDTSLLYAGVSYGMAFSFLSHTYLLFPYILMAVCAASLNVITNEKKLKRKVA